MRNASPTPKLETTQRCCQRASTLAAIGFGSGAWSRWIQRRIEPAYRNRSNRTRAERWERCKAKRPPLGGRSRRAGGKHRQQSLLNRAGEASLSSAFGRSLLNREKKKPFLLTKKKPGNPVIRAIPVNTGQTQHPFHSLQRARCSGHVGSVSQRVFESS